jgi:acetoin utilization protein AcuB
MIVQQLISTQIPFVTLSDTSDKALLLMQDFHISQLPIVQNGKYLGIVIEDDVLDLDDDTITINAIKKDVFRPMIMAKAHIYEALKIMQESQLVVLPILDEQEDYIGSITIADVAKHLMAGTQCAEPGGIIVLEVTQQNYSVGQIARCFESENVTILSMQIHTDSSSNSMQLSIKTNKQDLRAVVATLERLNYNVLEVFAEHQDNQDLQDNLAGLLNYLNI